MRNKKYLIIQPFSAEEKSKLGSMERYYNIFYESLDLSIKEQSKTINLLLLYRFFNHIIGHKYSRYVDCFIMGPLRLFINSVIYKSKAIVITDHALLPVASLTRLKVIAVIHDLTWLKEVAKDKRIYMPNKLLAYLMVRVIRKSSLIFVDSLATMKDLEKYIGTDTLKSKPVLLYLPIRRFPESENQENGLFTDFSKMQIILHVGSGELYKNRRHILKVFNLYRDSLKNGNNSEYLFVFAGEKLKNDEKKQIKDLDLIIEIENPSDIELVNLYKKASIFIFPSITEGFGWPPLEAQYFSTPVIATDGGSLAEILDGSAINISGDNPSDTLQKINELNYNDLLRDGTVKKGLDNVSRFTHSKFCRKLNDSILVYEK
jgi:glycosyltransferase involved in cell wall biosynthesis